MRSTFPEQLDIIVTQEDIDKGFPGGSSTCPVARAARRLFAADQAARVYVSGASVRVNTLRRRRFLFFRSTRTQDAIYALPDSAREFISEFDHYGTAAPVQFSAPVLYLR